MASGSYTLLVLKINASAPFAVRLVATCACKTSRFFFPAWWVCVGSFAWWTTTVVEVSGQWRSRKATRSVLCEVANDKDMGLSVSDASGQEIDRRLEDARLPTI